LSDVEDELQVLLVFRWGSGCFMGSWGYVLGCILIGLAIEWRGWYTMLGSILWKDMRYSSL
jgi:hypothetical protein